MAVWAASEQPIVAPLLIKAVEAINVAAIDLRQLLNDLFVCAASPSQYPVSCAIMDLSYHLDGWRVIPIYSEGGLTMTDREHVLDIAKRLLPIYLNDSDPDEAVTKSLAMAEILVTRWKEDYPPQTATPSVGRYSR